MIKSVLIHIGAQPTKTKYVRRLPEKADGEHAELKLPGIIHCDLKPENVLISRRLFSRATMRGTE